MIRWMFIAWSVVCPWLMANVVPLDCWILGNDSGETSFTPQAVSNLVDEVNRIYAQVALEFQVSAIHTTNDSQLAELVLSDASQKRRVCSLASNTGGLELYFVFSLSGIATAFYRPDGIVIGPSANVLTVAHELGHACGLSDVYDRHQETTLVVEGVPTRERMPDDWGWYPPNVMQTNIVRRLLMYGRRSDTKADISYGDVYGLCYTSSWNRVTRQWDRFWMKGMVPVGFGSHGNRTPTSK